MIGYCIPNTGICVMIIGSNRTDAQSVMDDALDKACLAEALECASKHMRLRAGLDRFRVLLASHIELERELIEADPKVVYG